MPPGGAGAGEQFRGEQPAPVAQRYQQKCGETQAVGQHPVGLCRGAEQQPQHQITCADERPGIGQERWLESHPAMVHAPCAGWRAGVLGLACCPGRAFLCQSRKMYSIVLVDDHAIVREGFKRLIEHLLSVHAATRVVVLSMHDGDAYVSEALRRGASGFVTKGVAPEELVAGLRAVMQGECFLSSDLRQRRTERPNDALDPVNRLTAREREVFLLLAGGRTPKQVAADLGIGQKTVYIHRASLMGKLGAGSELDLYRMATERGLLSTTV